MIMLHNVVTFLLLNCCLDCKSVIADVLFSAKYVFRAATNSDVATARHRCDLRRRGRLAQLSAKLARSESVTHMYV